MKTNPNVTLSRYICCLIWVNTLIWQRLSFLKQENHQLSPSYHGETIEMVNSVSQSQCHNHTRSSSSEHDVCMCFLGGILILFILIILFLRSQGDATHLNYSIQRVTFLPKSSQQNSSFSFHLRWSLVTGLTLAPHRNIETPAGENFNYSSKIFFNLVECFSHYNIISWFHWNFITTYVLELDFDREVKEVVSSTGYICPAERI